MAVRKEVYEDLCVEEIIYFHEGNKDTPFKSFDDFERYEAEENKKPKAKQTEEDTVFADKFGYFFYKLAGKDEILNSFELQRIMAMIFRKDFPNVQDFSLEACRSLVASMDTNRNGGLAYTQFKKLWFLIMEWKSCFEICDLDKDRKINQQELYIALERLGINLEENTLKLILSRYANKTNTIDLDSFIQICSRTISLKKSFESFNSKVSLDTFLLEIIYS